MFHCVNGSCFLYSLVCRWVLGSFQPLAIVKSAAVNMNVHLYFQTLVPIPLSRYPVVQFHILPLWHLTVVAVL